MVKHLVFYSCRYLGIQQQACLHNSTAHVQSVLGDVLTLHLYPTHRGKGFLLCQLQQETV